MDGLQKNPLRDRTGNNEWFHAKASDMLGEHLGKSWRSWYYRGMALTLQATWPRQREGMMSSDRGEDGREDMGERRESTLSHFIPGRESLAIHASMILHICILCVYLCITADRDKFRD